MNYELWGGRELWNNRSERSEDKNYEGIDGWAVSECGVLLLDNKARKEAVASFLVWSHKGLNLGPPDYESGATNQLSYETKV